MAVRPILQFLNRFNTRVSWLCLLLLIFFLTTFSHLNFNYTPSKSNAANIHYTHPGQPLHDDTQSPPSHSPSYTELAEAPLKVYIPPQALNPPDPLLDIWATTYHKNQASQEEDPKDKEAYSKALYCPVCPASSDANTKCPDFKQMLENIAQESPSNSPNSKGLSEGLEAGKSHCPDFKTMLKNIKAQECEKCPFDVSRCPGGMNDKDPHHHTKVGEPMPPPTTLPKIKDPDASTLSKKTLISYIYTPSPSSFTNLEFFTTHALHSQADFIITLFSASNSSTSTIPPEILNLPSQHSNIRILQKPLPSTTSSPHSNNTAETSCPQHPLAPHFEILNGTYSSLKDKYSHFILLDSSVRGPFLPRWSRECWSTAFLSLLSRKETVKMVGTGLACSKGFRPHLRTQALGLDSEALKTLLTYVHNPSLNNGTLQMECESQVAQAQKITQTIREQSWEVVVLDTTVADVSSYRYAECVEDEERFTGSVGKKGETDPWEVLFVDSRMAAMEGGRMELLSGRVKKGGYSSWDFCRAEES